VEEKYNMWEDRRPSREDWKGKGEGELIGKNQKDSLISTKKKKITA